MKNWKPAKIITLVVIERLTCTGCVYVTAQGGWPLFLQTKIQALFPGLSRNLVTFHPNPLHLTYNISVRHHRCKKH